MTIAWDRAILAAAILVACYLVAWAVRKLGADTAFRLVLALFVLIAAAVFVAPRSSSQPASSAFPALVESAIPSTAASFGGMAASRTRAETMTGAPRPKAVERPSLGTVATTRPGPTTSPASSAKSAGTAPTEAGRTVGGHLLTVRLSGIATWYRWRIGQAAAGPRLRAALGPHWRGRIVTVCGRVCLRATLTDWCGCPHGRVIDLDSRSFARLAPLSRGIVTVRLSW